MLHFRKYRPGITILKTATLVIALVSLQAALQGTRDIWSFYFLYVGVFITKATCLLRLSVCSSICISPKPNSLLNFIYGGKEFCLQGALILSAISSFTGLITFFHCWLCYSFRFFYPQWNKTPQSKAVEYKGKEDSIKKKMEKSLFYSLSLQLVMQIHLIILFIYFRVGKYVNGKADWFSRCPWYIYMRKKLINKRNLIGLFNHSVNWYFWSKIYLTNVDE